MRLHALNEFAGPLQVLSLNLAHEVIIYRGDIIGIAQNNLCRAIAYRSVHAEAAELVRDVHPDYEVVEHWQVDGIVLANWDGGNLFRGPVWGEELDSE